VPALAQLRAPLTDGVDVPGDRADALADAPPVGFQLGLARPARPDAAAQPRQRGPRADEARQQVLQLREFDLPLPFSRAGAAREDVQDQLRAIDDLAFDLGLDLAELRGRQLVVEDDHVHVALVAQLRQRAHLAAAQERARVRALAFLQHACDHGGARRLGKARQFVERLLGVHAAAKAGDEPDERSAFSGMGRSTRGTWHDSDAF
jgi:hypothetical protein